MQINIGERVLFRFFGIFEVYVFKVDIAVFHGHNGIFGILNGAFFVKHFHDTARGFHRHRHCHEYHREHHAVGKDLDAVCKQTGIVTDIEGFTAGGNDEMRGEETYADHRGIDGNLHEGVVKRKDFFRFREVFGEIARRFFEFFGFKIFAHEGFYHADAFNVFLNGFVEGIVFTERALEDRHNLSCDEEKRETENGHEANVNASERTAHNERHHERENKHKGRADCDADEHHECLLYVRDVRSQTCHKTGCGEFVDVGKGIFLNLVIKVVAQILCETAGCRGAEPARQHAAGQGSERKKDEREAVFADDSHFKHFSVFQVVDKLSGNVRDDTLDDNFEGDEKR